MTAAKRSNLSVFLLMLGSGGVTQLALFLGAILLARMYGPENFGMLAFYLGIGSVVAVVSGLRFELIGFSQEADKKNIYYVLSLVASVVVVLLVFGFSLLFNYDAACVLLLICASSALFYLTTQHLISVGSYRLFSILRLLQVIAQVVVGVLLFEILPDNGLLIAYSLSQLIIGLYILVWSLDCFKGICIAQLKAAFEVKLKGALSNSLTSLLQYSTPFAPALLGSFFYSSAEVGAYFVVSQAIAAPLAIFRRSVINFLNGQAATPKKALEILKGLSAYLFPMLLGGGLFIFFIGFCASLYGTELMALLFGPHWQGFGSIVVPILIYFIMDMLLQPLTTLLPLWGYHGQALKFEGIRFLLVFAVLPAYALLSGVGFEGFLSLYFLLMMSVYVITLIEVFSKLRALRGDET